MNLKSRESAVGLAGLVEEVLMGMIPIDVVQSMQ